MHTTDEIATTELARMCREESERYRRGRHGERGRCFELFRRAIVGRDQGAWTAICEQYWRLVIKWVNGPPDEVDARANRAFAKFWEAVPSETFGKFDGIGRIMSFLRKCARSVSIDEHRREEKHKLSVSLESVTAGTGDTTALRAIDNVLLQELFERIEGRLRDEQERLVFRLSFQVGLMPRQIAQEYPDQFVDVGEVRRIKERVVLRLSTDPRLREWWESRLGKKG
jgi:RNA polymerase sigma factor (sigma-70 family)